MFLSVVFPVFNRPDEMQEVLQCLCNQSFQNFEVIVAESGSEKKSIDVVISFCDKLNIKYIQTGNNGQGFSRNACFMHAKGDYFIVLDSDIIFENNFLQNIINGVSTQKLDFHGGPDRCHSSFDDIEKAINYSLTSFITTGGTRGNKNHVGTYYPRSFNMGFSRKVYQTVGGYKIPFMGEDIEFSKRMMAAGFVSGLVEEAYVYHHRKKTLQAFAKQMDFFGKARINIYKFFPDTLKFVHFIPAFFVIFICFQPILFLFITSLFWFSILVLFILTQVLFLDALRQTNSFKIAITGVQAAYIQLWSYGKGFIGAYISRVIIEEKKSDLKNI